jgi:hypothetical protein
MLHRGAVSLLLVSAVSGVACHAPATGSPAPTTLEASIGPYSVEPGQEVTKCIVFHLDNPAGAFVRRIRAELSPRSHHLTIYRSAATTEQRTPIDCRGFDTVLEGDQPLYIAQQARADLTFPSDAGGTPIGFAIDPQQMVRVEMHYLDTTPEPATAWGHVFLDTVPLSTTVIPADIAFWGTLDIHIPPEAAWQTPVKFVEAVPGNAMFALTTHQHQLGTRMRVWYADDPSDVAGAPLADSRSWSDPPVYLLSPPVTFGHAGGKKGLAYQCEWTNNTPNAVGYGEGFHDEMCFLWQYYFPGTGFDHLVQP